MSILSRRHLMVASAATTLAAPGLARAQAPTQAWPARQIRVIAPYPPGGGVDTVTRAFSEKVAPKVG